MENYYLTAYNYDQTVVAKLSTERITVVVDTIKLWIDEYPDIVGNITLVREV